MVKSPALGSSEWCKEHQPPRKCQGPSAFLQPCVHLSLPGGMSSPPGHLDTTVLLVLFRTIIENYIKIQMHE